MVGSIPVIYPFIVSNPGEAAQSHKRRRIAASGRSAIFRRRWFSVKS